jgi:hypothetical protein
MNSDPAGLKLKRRSRNKTGFKGQIPGSSRRQPVPGPGPEVVRGQPTVSDASFMPGLPGAGSRALRNSNGDGEPDASLDKHLMERLARDRADAKLT